MKNDQTPMEYEKNTGGIDFVKKSIYSFKTQTQKKKKKNLFFQKPKTKNKFLCNQQKNFFFVFQKK
jgi:hypothetical protein